jgi:enamine deaminase RidA (YjgF/YER057c/UK114 family)
MSVTRHEPRKILSSVVEGGGLVYTAGITADDFSLGVTEQTKQVLDEIDRLLAIAGSDKSKILSATIWVPDIRLRDGMNEAWNAWTGGENLPARACIEAKLARPDILVEIAVVALK